MAEDTAKKHEEILKDFLEIVDIPKEQKDKLNSGLYKVDEIKDSFHETYIARKMAVSDEDIKNRINGESARLVVDYLQKGFELSNDDVKDKSVFDVFDTGMKIQGKKVDALSEQIKTPAEGADQIKKLEEDLKSANEKTTIAVEGQQTANKQLEDKQVEFDGQMKQSKINMLLNNELGKLTFRDDINEIEKKGFNSLISEGYKFDLGDNGNLTVTDIEGNGVQNEKKTEHLTAGQVLSMEANTNKLLKLNNGTQTTQPIKPSNNGQAITIDAFGPQNGQQQNGQPVVPEKGKPVLHPSVIKHTEQLETASQDSSK